MLSTSSVFRDRRGTRHAWPVAVISAAAVLCVVSGMQVTQLPSLPHTFDVDSITYLVEVQNSNEQQLRDGLVLTALPLLYASPVQGIRLSLPWTQPSSTMLSWCS